MSDATVFYILAGFLAGLAVTSSFLGITFEGFPGKAAPVLVLVFVGLIGATTTFAVLNGQHEEEVRAAEVNEKNTEVESVENGSSPPEPGEAPAKTQPSKNTVSGPGGTLKLEASATELAFDTTTLKSEPGEVTIDLTNPSAIGHNIAIEQGSEILAESETVAEGKASVTQSLAPGEYTFLCTVPGHAEAGMEGTLTVE